MRTWEMKIANLEVNSGRCISTEGYILTNTTKSKMGENETSSISKSELECRIDPNIFAGAWLEHQPTTERQKETLDLYWDAKAKGRLHAFTCMTIDASVKDGKLVYQKGLPIKIGFSQRQWAKMLKDYNPSRNSRQIARTEYVCRNMYIIWKLVESGYEIAEAYEMVCDNSSKIGHYGNSDNPKNDFEPTGSRKVVGFCDLGNVQKLIAEDPWEKTGGFWFGSGCYGGNGRYTPISNLFHDYYVDYDDNYSVGVIAMD